MGQRIDFAVLDTIHQHRQVVLDGGRAISKVRPRLMAGTQPVLESVVSLVDVVHARVPWQPTCQLKEQTEGSSNEANARSLPVHGVAKAENVMPSRVTQVQTKHPAKDER